MESTHWFLIGPAFCEGILKQMKSLDFNRETPQKGNLYSYVYWKSTEKKKDKWHPPFRWCIHIHTYPFSPSAPPLPRLPSMPYTHAHTPFVPKYFKIKTVPSCEGHACVTITPEDSSQANTYLTVKTSQVCKCKLFVSVSFLDYAENFLLKVKLKGNKFYVIYLYSFSKKYREIFLKKLLKPAYENLHNFILYLLFKF